MIDKLNNKSTEHMIQGKEKISEVKGTEKPILFAHHSQKGKIKRSSSGDYKLILFKPDNQAEWFTDRPNREQGDISIQDLAEQFNTFFADSPPNTVMSYQADGEFHRLIFEQDTLRVSKKGNKLISRIKPLSHSVDDQDSKFRLATSASTKLSDPSLVIDDVVVLGEIIISSTKVSIVNRTSSKLTMRKYSSEPQNTLSAGSDITLNPGDTGVTSGGGIIGGYDIWGNLRWTDPITRKEETLFDFKSNSNYVRSLLIFNNNDKEPFTSNDGTPSYAKLTAGGGGAGGNPTTWEINQNELNNVWSAVNELPVSIRVEQTRDIPGVQFALVGGIERTEQNGEWLITITSLLP